MDHLRCRKDALVCNGLKHEWTCSFDNQYWPHLISVVAPYDLPITEFENVFVRPNWLRCPKDVVVLWMQRSYQEAEQVLQECESICAKHAIQGIVVEEEVLDCSRRKSF